MRTSLRNKLRSALGLVLAGSLSLAVFHAFGAVKVGESFPDLAAFKLEGKVPEGLKGKVVMVDFWASWCGPCRHSFPAMEELHKKYNEKGLVIVAINVDENKADMEDFLKKNAATFAVVRDAGQKLVERASLPCPVHS